MPGVSITLSGGRHFGSLRTPQRHINCRHIDFSLTPKLFYPSLFRRGTCVVQLTTNFRNFFRYLAFFLFNYTWKFLMRTQFLANSSALPFQVLPPISYSAESLWVKSRKKSLRGWWVWGERSTGRGHVFVITIRLLNYVPFALISFKVGTVVWFFGQRPRSTGGEKTRNRTTSWIYAIRLSFLHLRKFYLLSISIMASFISPPPEPPLGAFLRQPQLTNAVSGKLRSEVKQREQNFRVLQREQVKNFPGSDDWWIRQVENFSGERLDEPKSICSIDLKRRSRTGEGVVRAKIGAGGTDRCSRIFIICSFLFVNLIVD